LHADGKSPYVDHRNHFDNAILGEGFPLQARGDPGDCLPVQ
jgi:hypothetical protein